MTCDAHRSPNSLTPARPRSAGSPRRARDREQARPRHQPHGALGAGPARVAASRDPVTTRSAAASSSSIAGQEGEQLHDRLERLPARAVEPQVADGRSPQLLAVGVAERLDQGPHVGPRGAFDPKPGPSSPPRRAARRGGSSTSRGRASRSPRRDGPLVEPLAADLDRRGHRRRAGSIVPVGSSSRSGTLPGLGQLAVGVAGARAPAEPRRGHVGLRAPEHVALQARRAAEEHDQQAGRERVERARRGRPAVLAALAPDPATTSCEVTPAGLSTSRKPASAREAAQPSWAAVSAWRNSTSSS